MARDPDSRLVYSTDQGRIREQETSEPILGDGNIRIQQEKKGRGGKTASCIYGLPLAEKELKALAKELKKKCGTGGAVKNGVIEIQGEVADKLLSLLLAKGYAAKRSGA